MSDQWMNEARRLCGFDPVPEGEYQIEEIDKKYLNPRWWDEQIEIYLDGRLENAEEDVGRGGQAEELKEKGESKFLAEILEDFIGELKRGDDGIADELSGFELGDDIHLEEEDWPVLVKHALKTAQTWLRKIKAGRSKYESKEIDLPEGQSEDEALLRSIGLGETEEIEVAETCEFDHEEDEDEDLDESEKQLLIHFLSGDLEEALAESDFDEERIEELFGRIKKAAKKLVKKAGEKALDVVAKAGPKSQEFVKKHREKQQNKAAAAGSEKRGTGKLDDLITRNKIHIEQQKEQMAKHQAAIKANVAKLRKAKKGGSVAAGIVKRNKTLARRIKSNQEEIATATRQIKKAVEGRKKQTVKAKEAGKF